MLGFHTTGTKTLVSYPHWTRDLSAELLTPFGRVTSFFALRNNDDDGDDDVDDAECTSNEV